MPIVSKYRIFSLSSIFFLLSADDGGVGSLDRGSSRELITEKILDRRECVFACVLFERRNWESNQFLTRPFKTEEEEEEERKDDRLLLQPDATPVTIYPHPAGRARVSNNSRRRNMLITMFVLSPTPDCVCHYSTRDMTFCHRPASFDDDVFCLLILQWSVSLFHIFVSRQFRNCPSSLSSPSVSFM